MKDIRLYLDDILDAINAIEMFTKDMDKTKFILDRKTIDAVIRNIEIIGEASRCIPDAFKNEHPEIPWHKTIAMRNILIHEYAGVDLEIVWETIKKRIPELKKDVNDLLKKL